MSDRIGVTVNTEELVKRVSGTSSIIDQVNSIVISIVLCMISIAIIIDNCLEI